MPSSYVNQLGAVHLNNTAGAVTPGGDPAVSSATPFATGANWTPAAPALLLGFAGGQPFGVAQRLTYASYESTVEEEVPVGIEGTSTVNARRAWQTLTRTLRPAQPGAPIVWRMRPAELGSDAYADVYGGTVEHAPGGGENGIGPMEGGYQTEATLRLVRSAFWGAKDLETLISAASAANRGSSSPNNLLAFSTVALGDLIDDGQPLNLTIAKPAGMSAPTVYLATAHSRSNQTVTSSKTTASTTAGLAFTAGSSVDVSALRMRPGLQVGVFARFTTLTAPSKARVRIELQTPGGGSLWIGEWVALSTNTSAQLAFLGSTTLDAVRIPGSGALNAVPVITLRSSDGTSVTATLDTIDLVLGYTFGQISDASGLASGQSYQVQTAGNLSGGGWLPLPAPRVSVIDGSGVLVRRSQPRGVMPIALNGASLYVAWVDSGGAHTATDTTAITAQSAPLWQSLRGAS